MRPGRKLLSFLAVHRRGKMLLQPMPGEPGYTFDVHVNAFKRAIEEEREKKLSEAMEQCPQDRDPSIHLAQCEAMFDAAMRVICARNPEIAEAYREQSKPSGPPKKRRSSVNAALRLVHSA